MRQLEVVAFPGVLVTIALYNIVMLYESHVPRSNYTKIWPTKLWCPICNKNGIIRDGSHKPLYVPVLGTQGGERCVYYICNSCYVRYKNHVFYTLKDLKDHEQCRLELESHLSTLDRDVM